MTEEYVFLQHMFHSVGCVIDRRDEIIQLDGNPTLDKFLGIQSAVLLPAKRMCRNFIKISSKQFRTKTKYVQGIAFEFPSPALPVQQASASAFHVIPSFRVNVPTPDGQSSCCAAASRS